MAGTEEQVGQIYKNADHTRAVVDRLGMQVDGMQDLLREIQVGLVETRTMLKTYLRVAIALSGLLFLVIGWNARQTYNLNGSVKALEKIGASIDGLTRGQEEIRVGLNGIRDDIRDLRRADDQKSR
jgi:hypothetical protein